MKRINTTKTKVASLASVVHHFEHWRLTRKKRERIPDTLWKLVAPLMNQYGHNEIATALRVNHGQLKKYALLPLSHKQPKSTNFVEYPLPMAPLSSGVCVLEFACQNGSMVKISGLLPLEMQPLISLLMGN
jgi:hypothetical protein